MRLYLITIILITIQQYKNPYFSSDAQLLGGEKTMEQFLDRLLHENIYDRRIRPFYRYENSGILF
jgi:hypothetical protein